MTTVLHRAVNYAKEKDVVNYTEGKKNLHICWFKHECWHIFKISHPTLVIFLWIDPSSRQIVGLQFKIVFEEPYLTTQPPIKLSAHIYNVGP